MTNRICYSRRCSHVLILIIGRLALYCSKHKLENMVDVNNKIAVKDDFSGNVIYKIYCKDKI